MLKQTLSEALALEEAACDELDLGQKQRKRRRESLMEQTYHVDPRKLSAEFAVRAWANETREYHPGLLLLTIFVRIALGSVHGLREYLKGGSKCTMLINDTRLPTSALFQKLYNNGYRRVTTQCYDDLCYVMARMHLHSVFSTDDWFHTIVKKVLE